MIIFNRVALCHTNIHHAETFQSSISILSQVSEESNPCQDEQLDNYCTKFDITIVALRGFQRQVVYTLLEQFSYEEHVHLYEDIPNEEVLRTVNDVCRHAILHQQ